MLHRVCVNLCALFSNPELYCFCIHPAAGNNIDYARSHSTPGEEKTTRDRTVAIKCNNLCWVNAQCTHAHTTFMTILFVIRKWDCRQNVRRNG